MANDIDAELLAAGKELDKVLCSSTTLCTYLANHIQDAEIERMCLASIFAPKERVLTGL
jgi:hypothetical protein